MSMQEQREQESAKRALQLMKSPLNQERLGPFYQDIASGTTHNVLRNIETMATLDVEEAIAYGDDPNDSIADQFAAQRLLRLITLNTTDMEEV